MSELVGMMKKKGERWRFSVERGVLLADQGEKMNKKTKKPPRSRDEGDVPWEKLGNCSTCDQKESRGN